MRARARLLTVSILPLWLYAHTNGTPVGHTGAPTDNGGLTCAVCHTGGIGPASLSVSVVPYTPGRSQALTVVFGNDPAAEDFGFQLTARLVSDETKDAGYFLPTGNSAVYCANGQ